MQTTRKLGKDEQTQKRASLLRGKHSQRQTHRSQTCVERQHGRRGQAYCLTWCGCALFLVEKANTHGRAELGLTMTA